MLSALETQCNTDTHEIHSTSITAPWWPSGSHWTACCGMRPVCTLGCHGHGWYWLSAGFGCPTPLRRTEQRDMNAFQGTEVYAWRSKSLEVTDNDGAVCRSTVQLVSVKTNQCFVLIRYASSAVLHTITIVIAYICSLPLDTQSQHDAIMTFQSFLTFVGGAGVPHLRKNKKIVVLICVWEYLGLFPRRFLICVEVTLIVLSEDPEKSRSPVE